MVSVLIAGHIIHFLIVDHIIQLTVQCNVINNSVVCNRDILFWVYRVVYVSYSQGTCAANIRVCQESPLAVGLNANHNVQYTNYKMYM